MVDPKFVFGEHIFLLLKKLWLFNKIQLNVLDKQ